MATFTAFCQDADGGGTIWIQAVQAATVGEAITAARKQCAADWGFELASVQCLGIAAGDVEILHWDDLGED